MKIPKVLTVTRRPAELCAAKAMLNAAGFDVVTATNLKVALVAARSIRFDAAFVCRHSFEADEREEIATGLLAGNPELVIVGRCPGCVGCDEKAGVIGKLEDTDQIAAVVAAVTQARARSAANPDSPLRIM